MGKWLTIGAAVAILVVFVLVALSPSSRDRDVQSPAATASPGLPPLPAASAPDAPSPAGPVPVMRGTQPAPAPAPALVTGACAEPSSYSVAAADNALSLTEREWSPWGRAERGWEIYLPVVAQEIGTACPAGSPGFAASLAAWQKARRIDANGVLTVPTFEAMRVAWTRRRPFPIAMAKGVCPPGADPTRLVWAAKDEGYSGKPIQIRPAALAAYRNMVREARAAIPEIAANRQLLTIFSGYRAPAEDEARCDQDGGCGGPARARCSAHRTGMTLDIYLGAAPGSRPESSDDVNRLFLSRSSAYRWLVANAGRFGFMPYAFEPWHWEWTGEALEAGT